MITENKKIAAKKWRESEKGKETRYRYNHSPEEMEKRRVDTANYLSRPHIIEREIKRRATTGRKEQLRRADLMRKYKISLEDYDTMAINQNGLCLICEKKPTRLVVDHCHATGKVRGLLCDPCNVALGFLNDDTTLLRKAIQYLQ